ncbi:hypothetical protein DVDV_1623 [Desulfovibrio sp. DV]|uniref:hypothetical protein n=1 Tax=Desulfovibrio sp. DV TaxID=1844708 RepID=UPI0009643A94|nr:hypothetical protein [Desulfovibrio sp. DV]OLN28480.1 hypothetical protein DVDV_1623 [Desulfovibrio sp. DV]
MPKKNAVTLLVPIVSVACGSRPLRARVVWADGFAAEVDLSEPIKRFAAYAALAAPERFARVAVGEDGWTLDFGDDLEMPTDHVRLLALAQAGEIMPAQQFTQWRKRHHLTLAAAAKALGLAPRTVAYYDKGERLIPKTVGLACLGYDAVHKGQEAGRG